MQFNALKTQNALKIDFYMAQLFNGYKEVVNTTLNALVIVNVERYGTQSIAEEFSKMASAKQWNALDVKKHLHVLRTMGVRVTKRKGVWYLNGQKVEL